MFTIAISNQSPVFGDTVGFTATGGNLFGLYFVLSVTQNGQFVEGQTSAAWLPNAFTLGPTQVWQAGAAQGVCDLKTSRRGKLDRTVASLSFAIGA